MKNEVFRIIFLLLLTLLLFVFAGCGLFAVEIPSLPPSELNPDVTTPEEPNVPIEPEDNYVPDDLTTFTMVENLEQLTTALDFTTGDDAQRKIALAGNIDLQGATNLFTIPVGKSVTLNLNGYKISTNDITTGGYESIFRIKQDATLIINDNVGTGEIYYNYQGGNDGYQGKAVIWCEGTLIQNRGIIRFVGDSSQILSFGVDLRPNVWGEDAPTTPASYTLNDGAILTDNDTEAVRLAMNSAQGKGREQGVTFTMNGGEITGWDAIFVQQVSDNYANLTVVINAGTLTGAFAGIRIYATSTTWTYADGLDAEGHAPVHVITIAQGVTITGGEGGGDIVFRPATAGDTQQIEALQFITTLTDNR